MKRKERKKIIYFPKLFQLIVFVHFEHAEALKTLVLNMHFKYIV